jgi:hypothetical protein
MALHLGVVFSLFVTMPYGKFVHGIYRFHTRWCATRMDARSDGRAGVRPVPIGWQSAACPISQLCSVRDGGHARLRLLPTLGSGDYKSTTT